MKPQTEVLLIALAIAFAVALALSVALICMSSFEEKTGRDLFSGEGTDTNSVNALVTVTEEVTTRPPNSLAYRSNGDGTCTVVGIGTCGDFCINIPETSPEGEVVTAIEAGAFQGCTSVTAVGIPATVDTVGKLAFANCPNLILISVNRQNPYYTDLDGVLFTSDLGTLLAYPSKKAEASYQLPASVICIEEMAFYGCKNLQTILFSGSPEAWDRLSIGAKNYSLTAASIRFENG